MITSQIQREILCMGMYCVCYSVKPSFLNASMKTYFLTASMKTYFFAASMKTYFLTASIRTYFLTASMKNMYINQSINKVEKMQGEPCSSLLLCLLLLLCTAVVDSTFCIRTHTHCTLTVYMGSTLEIVHGVYILPEAHWNTLCTKCTAVLTKCTGGYTICTAVQTNCTRVGCS